MEIKSSLLNEDDFKFVKKSLIDVSEIDGKDKFRVKTLEYINDSSSDDDDIFFFFFFEFVRFLQPNDEAIAYTTPDHLIWLNCPGHIGEQIRQWDFIYDHECLHQLWDTFGVEDKIRKDFGTCDHYIMNIASDCIINDYLSFYRKKSQPDGLITPEYIKTKYDIEYNRKVDTQYTLYLKLLEKNEELKKDDLIQNNIDDFGQDGDSSQNSGGGSSSQNNQSKNGKGGKGQGQSQDSDGNNKNNDKNQGNNQGDNGKDGKDGQDGQGGKDGQDGQDGKDGKANGSQDGKSGGGNQDGKSDGKDGKDGNGKSDDNSKGGSSHAGVHLDPNMTDADRASIKEKADKLLNKHKNKISGMLGEFLKKCKSSSQLNKTGIEIKTPSGSSSWKVKMDKYINLYIKKRVYEKQRMMEQTYSRVKRGSGFIEFGKPIIPGHKKKEEKLTINTAFYIDRSGSMGSSLKTVFEAAYSIAEALKKRFSHERVVKEVDFGMYSFDSRMIKIKFGDIPSCGGTTMSFAEIVEYIQKNTNDYMINIIITDGEFPSSDVKAIDNLIKTINGIIVVIVNQDNDTLKKTADKYEGKMYYILADSNFTV